MRRLLAHRFEYETANDGEDYDYNIIRIVDEQTGTVMGSLTYSYRSENHEIRIDGIGVLPKFQGKNLAKKLILELNNQIQKFYKDGQRPKVTAMLNPRSQQIYDKGLIPMEIQPI